VKYTLDKLEQTLVATILAFCLILIFSIAGAVHFYTFRAGATAQIAELEKKIQDLEEAQRNVNGYFSRELSRTQGELWTLEKITRGGKSDGRQEGQEPGARIHRPQDRGPQREGNRGYIAPAKISGST
jgi:hypothetical protein